MKLHFVDSMDEVLKIALERELVALPMPAGHPASKCSPWKRTGRIRSYQVESRGCRVNAGAASHGVAERFPGGSRTLTAEFVVSAGTAGSVPLRPAAGDCIFREK